MIISIQLLINHQDYIQARALLDIHHKQIGHDDRLLALEIKLSLIEKRYPNAIERLVAARKSKSISSINIAEWEASAFLGMFNEQIETHNESTLNSYWNNLPRKLKQRESIVLAYCQVLAKHQINQALNDILLPVIKKGANDALLKAMRRLPLTSANELIQVVQKHLHGDKTSAKWLSCLAHLAASSQQWSMAEKAFNSLVQLENKQYDKIDLLTFAKVLEQQNQLSKAIEVLYKITEMPSQET